MMRALTLTAALALALTIAAAQAPAIHETFDRGLDNWWVEGGERVWVEDGKLYVRADAVDRGKGVATVWCKTPHPANFRLTLDAHVVSSSIDANNINLFFNYTDPAGRPLYDTRASRATADYNLYHALSGYIVTFLNDVAAASGRVRIRRNPGFRLLAETFSGECRKGVTYRLRVEKTGGVIRFLVDGAERLRAQDPAPLSGGLLGLRTYRTHLWWDNVRLEAVP